MDTTMPKPWTLAMLGASAIPFAAYLAFVCTDAVLCGVGHALWIAIFAAVLVPVPAAAAAALAAIGLACWRGPFDSRRIGRVFALLAFAAAAAAMVYGLQGEHNPQDCLVAL